jgi:hypothetical protein
MASRGSQAVASSCDLNQIISKGNVNHCDKCKKINNEVTELQNELKLAQLIVRLLWEERNNWPSALATSPN